MSIADIEIDIPSSKDPPLMDGFGEARVLDVLNYPDRHQSCGRECWGSSDDVRSAHVRVWRMV